MLFPLVLIVLVHTKEVDLLQPHCVIQQIEGKWTFNLTNPDQSRADSLSMCKPETVITPTDTIEFDLQLPNIAINTKTQTQGTWTMVIDVGVEIRIDGKRYIFFFFYTKNWIGKVTSHCDETWTGWYRIDDGKLPRGQQFGCMRGVKQPDSNHIFVGVNLRHEYLSTAKTPSLYGTGRKFEPFRVAAQRDHMELMKKYRAPAAFNINDLPEKWDWTHVEGESYVPYVKDQEQCGSCYIFSVVGMLEGRKRVDTKLAEKPLWSEQDVLNCGAPTNDGCGGGFPFLVSKFFQEWGIVTEKDVGYDGWSNKCNDGKYTKYNVTEYSYLGGYYGASTEEAMMLELYTNGPMAISFFVEDEFFNYQEGVYTCATHKPGDANHAVVLVGYGSEDKGKLKYWKVRNSWGSGWGDGGYFLMRRGKNDCNIEAAPSIAFVRDI